jgi:hypothetical protein
MLTSSRSSSFLSLMFHPWAAPGSGTLEACDSALGLRWCVCSPPAMKRVVNGAELAQVEQQSRR